jgi:hypothetical protein
MPQSPAGGTAVPGTGPSPEVGASQEQVLDGLDVLATVEHALCVEYLTIQAAVGPDPEATGPTADRIREASDKAFGTALGEMGHLHRINNALTLAGRRPQVGRAARIERAGAPDIVLDPPGGTKVEHFLERNRLIAEAVDAAYERLRSAAQAVDPPFEGELLDELTFVLDPGPHVEPVVTLRDILEAIPATEYLRATRREPSSALEQSLLHLADLHYNLIVATVRAWFEHAAEAGGDLRGRALSAMDGAATLNAMLVERGLLPAFAFDPGGDDVRKEATP